MFISTQHTMSNHSISPPFGIAKPKRKRPIKHLAINHVMVSSINFFLVYNHMCISTQNTMSNYSISPPFVRKYI